MPPRCEKCGAFKRKSPTLGWVCDDCAERVRRATETKMPKPNDPAEEIIAYLGDMICPKEAEMIRDEFAPLLKAADGMASTIKSMLYIFDRQLPISSIGRKRCDDVIAALAAYRKLRPEEDGNG